MQSITQIYNNLLPGEYLDVSNIDVITGLGAGVMSPEEFEIEEDSLVYDMDLRIVSRDVPRYIVAIQLLFGNHGFIIYEHNIRDNIERYAGDYYAKPLTDQQLQAWKRNTPAFQALEILTRAFQVPQMTIPQPKVPQITIPQPKVPQVTIPNITHPIIPQVPIPTIPNTVTIPNIPRLPQNLIKPVVPVPQQTVTTVTPQVINNLPRLPRDFDDEDDEDEVEELPIPRAQARVITPLRDRYFDLTPGRVLDVSNLTNDGRGARVIIRPLTQRNGKIGLPQYNLISNNYISYARALRLIFGDDVIEEAMRELEQFRRQNPGW